MDSNIKRELVILGEKNVISKSYASSGLVSVPFLLGFMTRLHLQQCQRAIENVVVFFNAGAVLLITSLAKSGIALMVYSVFDTLLVLRLKTRAYSLMR